MKMRLTKYDLQEDRVCSAVGTPVVPTFKMKVEKDGSRRLVEDGSVDLYAQIQSHALSCDINYILTQFANGDTGALSKAQGFYADLSGAPTSVQELQQRVVDAENLFYQLPLDIREKFGHDPSKFYSQIGTDSFNEILGIDQVKDSPIKDVDPVAPSMEPSVDPAGGVESE